MRPVACCLAILLSVVSWGCASPTGPSDGPPPTVLYSEVVAADHPVASEAGARALQQGGNAVDAAVAAAFALSVVRPQSCGIGGGGFMVIWLPPNASRDGGWVETTIDSREWCPAGVHADSFSRSPDMHASTVGGMAVAVPGSVAGLLNAQTRYGRLDRKAVLQPAIDAARGGFVVDRAYMAAAEETIEKFRKDPGLQARFVFLWDLLLRRGAVREGDYITNPGQAFVLERIAEDGADGFYRGKVGEAIAASVHSAGGVLSEADLAAYLNGGVRERPVLKTVAFGRTVLTMPPPSSGGVALCQTLTMLKAMHAEDPVDAGGDAFAHELVECFKLSFADRATFLADPGFTRVPLDKLMSGSDVRMRAKLIDAERTYPASRYVRGFSGSDANRDHGTSHVSAVDRWGGACAATQTINLFFGSYVCPEGCGFLLNNEMDDFTTRPGEANAFGLRQSDANAPAPGKRPLSSMTPTIILDPYERVEIVAGASGGPRIITATAQAVLNVLLRADDAATAVSRPRLHHQWMPDVVRVEDGVAEDVRSSLTSRGHKLSEAKGEAAVQLIARSTERDADGRVTYTAASDPRKGGSPAGRAAPVLNTPQRTGQ